jgi:hypothetical protein
MKVEKLTSHDGMQIFTPIHEKTLEKINIVPGDIYLYYNDDNTPYGACGAVYETQVNTSKQITFQETK